jgi:preprotein translocase subunit SecG
MTILVILAMAASVLLVLVVLAQNSKGGGLSSQFGGSGASNLIGVKKTGDLLERLTWAFAIAIMIFSLGTNLMDPNSGGDDILDKVKDQRTAPTNNAIPDLQNSAKPDSAK